MLSGRCVSPLLHHRELAYRQLTVSSEGSLGGKFLLEMHFFMALFIAAVNGVMLHGQGLKVATGMVGL